MNDELRQALTAFYAAQAEVQPEQHEIHDSHAKWPIKSIACAVDRRDVEKAKERDRKLGAPPTEYTKGGRPVWTSEAHKRKYIKAHGLHDNNSFS